MATKELFIKEILSDEIVAAGRRLLQRLDAQQADVRCAFWFLMEEERQWKMVLVSPLVDSSGPRDFYKRVMKANKEAEEQEKVIALGHIVASGLDEQPAKSVMASVHLDPPPVPEWRQGRTNMNGLFLEDILIYRSSDKPHIDTAAQPIK